MKHTEKSTEDTSDPAAVGSYSIPVSSCGRLVIPRELYLFFTWRPKKSRAQNRILMVVSEDCITLFRGCGVDLAIKEAASRRAGASLPVADQPYYTITMDSRGRLPMRTYSNRYYQHDPGGCTILGCFDRVEIYTEKQWEKERMT